MTKQRAEALRDIGRKVAEEYLERGVDGSANASEMTEQIYILHHMALSILAHEIYNRERQLKIAPDDTVDEMMNELYEYYDWICEGDPELLKTGRPI